MLVVPSEHPLGALASIHLDQLSELELLLPAAGYRAASRDRQRHRAGAHHAAPGYGARRRPPHRLARV